MAFDGQDQVKEDLRLSQLQEGSTAFVAAQVVSPMEDIERERASASFDPKELCRLINGGQATLDR
eukprot:scaffold653283_cov46-Prasinocladus_malaysianus.AAC.1